MQGVCVCVCTSITQSIVRIHSNFFVGDTIGSKSNAEEKKKKKVLDR